MSAPIILRQRSGPIITIIVWAFLALMILDAIVRDAWDTVGTFLPPLALIGWLVFVLLWRPALIVGTEQIITREILRTTTVPFAAISDIRLSTVVSIIATTPDGATRTYRPWNAPGTPRRKIDSGLTGGTPPESVDNHPAVELLRRWENHRPATGTGPATATGSTVGGAVDGAVDGGAGAEAGAGGDVDAGGQGPEATTTVWNLGVIGVTLVLVLLVIVGSL